MENQVPQHKIEFGKFKGKLIDNRTRYTLSIRDEDEQSFLVDYFFHKGKFFSARIPKRSVQSIVGQRFTFSKINPFITHAQVRINLEKEKPLELYELGESENPTELLYEFVYSIEVVGPKGASWSLSQSFGAFLSAHRLLSLEEVVFERVVLGQYEVIQSSPILLRKELLNIGMEEILRRGNKAKMDEKYYLFNLAFGANNCTSEVFEILDDLLSKEYTPIQKILSKIFWRFPFAPRLYLRFRGVLDRKEKAPTLNEEFSELAKSPEMLERLKKIREKRQKS